MSEKKLERDEKGRFLKGHKETIGNDNASKYKDEYPDLVISFMNEQIDKGLIPFLQDFAVDVADVDEDTICNWTEKYPCFRNSIKKFLTKQKAILMQKGANGEANANFVARLLSIIHGMNEKTETENTVTLNVKLDREIDEESN